MKEDVKVVLTKKTNEMLLIRFARFHAGNICSGRKLFPPPKKQ